MEEWVHSAGVAEMVSVQLQVCQSWGFPQNQIRQYLIDVFIDADWKLIFYLHFISGMHRASAATNNDEIILQAILAAFHRVFPVVLYEVISTLIDLVMNVE